jgi:hypothetical protein
VAVTDATRKIPTTYVTGMRAVTATALLLYPNSDVPSLGEEINESGRYSLPKALVQPLFFWGGVKVGHVIR